MADDDVAAAAAVIAALTGAAAAVAAAEGVAPARRRTWAEFIRGMGEGLLGSGAPRGESRVSRAFSALSRQVGPRGRVQGGIGARSTYGATTYTLEDYANVFYNLLNPRKPTSTESAGALGSTKLPAPPSWARPADWHLNEESGVYKRLQTHLDYFKNLPLVGENEYLEDASSRRVIVDTKDGYKSVTVRNPYSAAVREDRKSALDSKDAPLPKPNKDVIEALGITATFPLIGKKEQIMILEALWLAGTQMKMRAAADGFPLRLLGELAETIKVGDMKTRHEETRKVLLGTYVGAFAKAIDHLRGETGSARDLTKAAAEAVAAANAAVNEADTVEKAEKAVKKAASALEAAKAAAAAAREAVKTAKAAEEAASKTDKDAAEADKKATAATLADKRRKREEAETALAKATAVEASAKEAGEDAAAAKAKTAAAAEAAKTAAAAKAKTPEGAAAGGEKPGGVTDPTGVGRAGSHTPAPGESTSPSKPATPGAPATPPKPAVGGALLSARVSLPTALGARGRVRLPTALGAA